MFILKYINKPSYEEEWPFRNLDFMSDHLFMFLFTHLINIIEPWTKNGNTDRCKY